MSNALFLSIAHLLIYNLVESDSFLNRNKINC